MTIRDPYGSKFQARWVPRWHELDQSLRRGEIGQFLFFPADQPAPPDDRSLDVVGKEGAETQNASTDPWAAARLFYNQFLDEHTAVETRQARIIEIMHPQWGELASVDTGGLDYVFRFLDGTEWIVNAEEEPGVTYDCPQPPSSWELHVTLVDVGDLAS